MLIFTYIYIYAYMSIYKHIYIGICIYRDIPYWLFPIGYSSAYSHLRMRMQWAAPMPPPPCAGPPEDLPAPRTDGPAAPKSM